MEERLEKLIMDLQVKKCKTMTTEDGELCRMWYGAETGTIYSFENTRPKSNEELNEIIESVCLLYDGRPVPMQVEKLKVAVTPALKKAFKKLSEYRIGKISDSEELEVKVQNDTAKRKELSKASSLALSMLFFHGGSTAWLAVLAGGGFYKEHYATSVALALGALGFAALAYNEGCNFQRSRRENGN